MKAGTWDLRSRSEPVKNASAICSLRSKKPFSSYPRTPNAECEEHIPKRYCTGRVFQIAWIRGMPSSRDPSKTLNRKKVYRITRSFDVCLLQKRDCGDSTFRGLMPIKAIKLWGISDRTKNNKRLSTCTRLAVWRIGLNKLGKSGYFTWHLLA